MSTQEQKIADKPEKAETKQPEVKPVKAKKKKAKGEKFKLTYICQASAEMMVSIFTLKEGEDRFLKAVFRGQIIKKDDMFVIGDGASFTYKIRKNEVNDDDQHRLEMAWHRKEWEDDVWSTVTMLFTDDDEVDKKCELQFKQTGIPTDDKHGNTDQSELIKQFWVQHVFKGLTQFGNISCTSKKE
eukprot:CAMPEP_0202701876 /NCGR_PEP_ID=MMETSP1385-20130828/14925_1 /ASSEMBLY_ACC=CAM_ASM_000861 /TAXON_ID=933848 /ORGANISM="Elphidium margaritaceum" /LENGTH=184 /DNA_ID=CAMNT_0049359393 /DNA_START=20 /DNA_END=574 /DNA_ORIENTATION=+